MSTIVERLRNGLEYADRIEAADELELQASQIRILTAERDALKLKVSALVNDVHSCHANCAKAGCMAGRLRAEVAGLREDAERWRHVRDKCGWTATSANGMTRIAIRLMVDTPIEADDELDAAVDEARKAVP